MPSCGGPGRNQSAVAPPPSPPPPPPPPAPVWVGPDPPQAASAVPAAAPAATPRKVRRDIVLGSTLISRIREPRRRHGEPICLRGRADDCGLRSGPPPRAGRLHSFDRRPQQLT